MSDNNLRVLLVDESGHIVKRKALKSLPHKVYKTRFGASIKHDDTLLTPENVGDGTYSPVVFNNVGQLDLKLHPDDFEVMNGVLTSKNVEGKLTIQGDILTYTPADGSAPSRVTISKFVNRVGQGLVSDDCLAMCHETGGELSLVGDTLTFTPRDTTPSTSVNIPKLQKRSGDALVTGDCVAMCSETGGELTGSDFTVTFTPSDGGPASNVTIPSDLSKFDASAIPVDDACMAFEACP